MSWGWVEGWLNPSIPGVFALRILPTHASSNTRTVHHHPLLVVLLPHLVGPAAAGAQEAVHFAQEARVLLRLCAYVCGLYG